MVEVRIKPDCWDISNALPTHPLPITYLPYFLWLKCKLEEGGIRFREDIIVPTYTMDMMMRRAEGKCKWYTDFFTGELVVRQLSLDEIKFTREVN